MRATSAKKRTARPGRGGAAKRSSRPQRARGRRGRERAGAVAEHVGDGPVVRRTGHRHVRGARRDVTGRSGVYRGQQWRAHPAPSARAAAGASKPVAPVASRARPHRQDLAQVRSQTGEDARGQQVEGRKAVRELLLAGTAEWRGLVAPILDENEIVALLTSPAACACRCRTSNRKRLEAAARSELRRASSPTPHRCSTPTWPIC